MDYYSLIKAYPGSAPKSTNFVIDPNMKKYYISSCGCFSVSLSDIENKEFFEKIYCDEKIGSMIRITPKPNEKVDKTIYRIVSNDKDGKNLTIEDFRNRKMGNQRIRNNASLFQSVVQYYFFDSKGAVQNDFCSGDDLIRNDSYHFYRKFISGNFFNSREEMKNAEIKALKN